MRMKQIFTALVLGFSLLIASGGIKEGIANGTIVDVEEDRWKKLSGNGEAPLSLEQLGEVHKKLLSNVKAETLWGSIEADALEASVDCMKANGSPKFCRCLAKKLPVVLSYGQYVTLVLYGYNVPLEGVSSSDKKKLVETIYEIRDQCVSASVNSAP